MSVRSILSILITAVPNLWESYTLDQVAERIMPPSEAELETLKAWLETHHLSDSLSALKTLGVGCVADMSLLEATDLGMVELSPIARRRLLNIMQSIKS